MILILLIALAIYFLIQITTWTLSSFHSGIIVFSFSTSLANTVPKDLINRMIEIEGGTFKFVTKNTALFRTSFRRTRRPSFPLLGEIWLSKIGMAQIKIRVPLSFMLLTIVSFIGLVSFFVQGVDTPDIIIQSLLEASGIIAIIGVFFLFGFLVEKDRIQYLIEQMKKYLGQQNTNSDSYEF